MIERAPENKSLPRDPAQIAMVPAPAPKAADPEAVRKAREEFAAATAVAPPPPGAPRVIGYGTCPKCRVSGSMIATGVGEARTIRYEGCKCPKK